MINPIDGSLQVFSAPPSSNGHQSFTMTDSGTQGRPQTGEQLWGELFRNINKLPVDFVQKKGAISFPHPSQIQSPDNPAELQLVDLKLSTNSMKTSFSQRKNLQTAQLVLSRGTNFEFDLYFYRTVNLKQDILKVTFETEDKSERITAELKEEKYGTGKTPNPWNGTIRQQGDILTITVHIPSNAAKGWWNLHIETSLVKNDTEEGYKSSESMITGLYLI